MSKVVTYFCDNPKCKWSGEDKPQIIWWGDPDESSFSLIDPDVFRFDLCPDCIKNIGLGDLGLLVDQRKQRLNKHKREWVEFKHEEMKPNPPIEEAPTDES